MTTPGNGGPEKEKEKGLDRLLTRMKSVLRRSDGSKRLSFSGRSKSVSGPSDPKPEPVVAEEPVAAAEPGKNIPAGAKKMMRSEVEAERRKKLAERFAIDIEPLSTKPDKEAYRIEKPVRMRIHRTCHKCNTTFGGTKICVNCEHPRCAKCPRFPSKKPEGKGKSKEAAAVTKGDIIEPDTWWGLKQEVKLTMPNPKAHGQPLVRKVPRQRIRRTCCKCSALFGTGGKICTSCEHPRCADCPRDPAKKKKYPDGYPGDAPSDDVSKPVKYTCHKCSKAFPPVPHPDSEEGKALAGSEPQECVRCQHPRCSDCPRALPVKVEPAPDPDVWKSVQAKLAALNV